MIDVEAQPQGLTSTYLQIIYPRYIALGLRGPCAGIGNAASPAAVVILTATADPVTAEEVCGIVCRRSDIEARLLNGTTLIYGATGYTGRLIAKAANDRGARPILAGRNLDKVKRVAEPLGLIARAFDLGDPARIDAAIKDVSVVLCAAGPFSATSQPVADARLRNRVHYLDITGEIDVFEALAARDAEAKARGIMLLPGVGFDVAPSDCLAAHLKRRLPDANDLKLYLSLGANMSRGTAKTMIEAIAAGTRMRRNGRIVSRDRAEVGSCDFGEGEKPTVQVGWGDVATAFHSTGIPQYRRPFRGVPSDQGVCAYALVRQVVPRAGPHTKPPQVPG
jgi:NAD(P)-dependent dehydrogenase (short-subunit alcohol dehydrogenase family)